MHWWTIWRPSISERCDAHGLVLSTCADAPASRVDAPASGSGLGTADARAPASGSAVLSPGVGLKLTASSTSVEPQGKARDAEQDGSACDKNNA